MALQSGTSQITAVLLSVALFPPKSSVSAQNVRSCLSMRMGSEVRGAEQGRAQGCGAVPASLVAPEDTKLGLTLEFQREKPELGGLSPGRRARDSCVLQSPADLLGCKIKVRLLSLPFDCDLCEDKKSLWSLLRSLLGQNVSPALGQTQLLGLQTFPPRLVPRAAKVLRLWDVLHEGFSCSRSTRLWGIGLDWDF